MSIDERLEAISRDLDLLRHMQLDNMRRADRQDRKLNLLIGALAKTTIGQRINLEEVRQRVEDLYEQFMDDLQDLTGSNGNESQEDQ